MSGTIMAIGGNIRLDGPIIETFYQFSGGADGRIAILPTASERPESGTEYAQRLDELGLGSARSAWVLPVHERQHAGVPEFLNCIREATGIFITGGNPVRLTAVLGGTALHQELLAAHQRGAVIAGSSAGSAALGGLMIASGHGGPYARQRIAQFAPGLGILSNVIFDQHFRQRNRLGRLIYAVASNPSLLGIGIDEDTVAILQDDQLRVLGSSAVTIVDGSDVTESNVADAVSGQVIAISGVRLHVLTHGSTFDLQTRCARISAKE